MPPSISLYVLNMKVTFDKYFVNVSRVDIDITFSGLNCLSKMMLWCQERKNEQNK